MKDIPFFHTENGVASLRLKEIPFFRAAYITMQSALDERKLLEDCVGLCKAAGAERIYATGLSSTEYGESVNILKMTCDLRDQQEASVQLFPVQEKTLSQWRELYNQKMYNVTGAAYMSDPAAHQMLTERNGYFVHKNGELIGIGAACGDTISVVASLKKGAGKDVVQALMSVLSEDRAVIEAASDNTKAITLYTSLNFIPACIVNTWYKII